MGGRVRVAEEACEGAAIDLPPHPSLDERRRVGWPQRRPQRRSWARRLPRTSAAAEARLETS